VRKELEKNTIKTMKLLVDTDNKFIEGFLDVVFQKDMWLKPTMEKK